MLQYFDTLTDDSGNALLGATVTVTNFVGGALATIYSANGTSAPIANSVVVADITGQVSFYAPDGPYTLTYAYKGTIYKVRSPVQFLDPIGFVAANDTGAANAYVLTGAQLPAQKYVGLKVEAKIATTNTGASTLNFQTDGGFPITVPGGTALSPGMLQANGLHRFEWDGVEWQLLTPALVAGSIGGLLYPQTAQEAAFSLVPVNTSYPPGNAWRWLTAAQLASVQAFNFAVECGPALQNWLDGAYVSNVDAFLPGGGYLCNSTTLIINHGYLLDGLDYRGRCFHVYGAGAGSVQARSVERTSVIQSTSNASYLMRWQQYLGPVTDSQPYEVTRIRFEQQNAAATLAVVQLDVLGYFSRFAECEIWQQGTGDGLRLLELTQGRIERCTIQNRDWVAATPWNSTTAYVVGNQVIQGQTLYVCILANTNNAPPNATFWTAFSRQGVGVDIFVQYNAGKGTVRECSVRGFQYGFALGVGGGAQMQGVTFEDLDVSNVFYGVYIATASSFYQDKTVVQRCYLEGVEGTCIVDQGTNTVIRDNALVTASYSIGIDASASGGGGVYDGNEIPLGTQFVNNVAGGFNGTVGISYSPFNAAAAVSITNNRFSWAWSGTGLTNCGAIKLTGADPNIHLYGNTFAPLTPWTGGAGTATIINNTTTADGSGTLGDIGFSVGTDGARSFPVAQRFAYALYGNPTPLANGAVSANTLTLGQASYYLATFTVAQTINAIAGMRTGQVVVIRVTNANATFTAGANIKLAGSVNFTPGANGASITFICRPGSGVMEELCRTAY